MEERDNLYRMRHSAAHLLAMAVLDRHPDAKLGIGPVIEHGFYYDFDLAEPIRPEELPELEEKMRAFINDPVGFNFERKVISRDEAKGLFHNQPYKL
ncbi:MAG: threonine--tRNA ligase, partial [Bacteroidota bacterium]